MTVGRRRAFVFPGQGSQRVGMLRSPAETDLASRLLDAAGVRTGLDLRVIAETGPDAALADTRAAQPLLFIADLAWAYHLQDQGLVPDAVAGHSLGELAALAFAGVFTPEEGVELVCERARIMAEVARATPGTMAAVLGMESALVAELVGPISGVWVANDNGPGQVVLSGRHDGIEAATDALTAAGARRIVPLAVAGPFHCPLMAPAAEAFAAVLEEHRFADAAIPVVQNTEPTPASSADVLRTRLAEQITRPVRWTETMEAFTRMGIEVLVECGPGSVLTGLARRVDTLDGVSVETDGLERVREVLGR